MPGRTDCRGHSASASADDYKIEPTIGSFTHNDSIYHIASISVTELNGYVASSLRTKQRLRVRGDIDAAALRLFVERGYGRVTTEEIAEAAGVSPSTYFRHVPSKEDLLLRPLRSSSAAIVSLFAEDSESDVTAGLVAAIRTQTGQHDPQEHGRWRSVIQAVPGILDRVALITEADRTTLIDLAADRMGLDPQHDWAPGTTVCSLLAVVEYGFRRWMGTTEQSTLITCIDAALESYRR